MAKSGKRKRADDGNGRWTEAMTAIRLIITIWELIQAAVRGDHWLGGPGRLL